ncbi:MAG: DUF4058 family protein [Anaerolineae bacterium]
MPSPFPGMDPYLEEPALWQDFHADLAVTLKHHLNQRIGPKYYATVETQSVPYDLDVEIANRIRPDVSIYEPFDAALPELPSAPSPSVPAAPIVLPAVMSVKLRSVRIYRTETGELVTTIEILSPFNKRPASDGLMQYRLKRAQLLASRAHLVEIDLLRGGERPALELADHPIDTDYVLLVNRFGPDRVSEIWPVAVDERLPLIPIPLLPPDTPVALDLNDLIRDVYAGSGYDWRINYQRPAPLPAIRPAVERRVADLVASRKTS